MDAQVISRCKKPKYTLGPRPDATVRPFRGLTNHRATFTSLEVSPPRPLTVRHISASPEGEGSPSEHRRTPPHSRPPRPSPPRGLGSRGNSASVETTPRQTGTATHPVNGQAHLLPTTPPQSAVVRWRQSPRRTTDMTGVPSANSGHYAAIPALCGPATRCANMPDTAPATVLPTLCTSSSAGPTASMGNNPRTRYDH